MDEIGGAIQRVDYPLVGRKFALGCLTVQAGFFRQERMIRVGRAQHIDNGFFGATIDFRDIISGPFSGDLKAVKVNTGAVDNGTGAPGRLDGDIKHRVHKLGFFY